MRVTGKPVRTSVGLCFIALALIAAGLVLPGAKESQEPLPYVCIFGGLFIGIPAALGIGIVLNNRRKLGTQRRQRPSVPPKRKVREGHCLITTVTCKTKTRHRIIDFKDNKNAPHGVDRNMKWTGGKRVSVVGHSGISSPYPIFRRMNTYTVMDSESGN